MTNTTQQPSPNVLIAGCQGLVRNIAWKVHRKVSHQVELDDLIAYGQLGLVEAAQKFDASRGARFSTYAYYRIRGAIFDGLSEMAWFTARGYHEGRYERLAGEVLEDDAEQSDMFPDSPEGNTRWLTDVSARLAVVSIMTQEGGGYGSGVASASRQSEMPADQLQVRELASALRASVDKLPDQQKSLIVMTYYEGLSLKEAGERLGFSKSWASRLHGKALRRLSKALLERGVA
ncbi:sigma-70 family RNA polymerase sigma factor [Phycisphaeraceae bacterium D3-23]